MKFKIIESLESNLIDKFFKDSSWIDEIRDRLQYLDQEDLEIEYNEDPIVKLIIDNAHSHYPEDNDYEGIVRDFINLTAEFMFYINDEDKDSFEHLIKENPFMETFFEIYNREWPDWNKIEESLQDKVQYGVHQFSTESIIFRGTEEECIKYIDDRPKLWDDAEVYFMTPDDPHYQKNESINEGADMKFKLIEAAESKKILDYKDQIKNCKSWEDLQELSTKIKNDSMLSADEEYNLRFDIAEKNKEFNLNENKESKICCICKKPFEGYGNNAEPVCSGRCCDRCNIEKVIPMRFKMMKNDVKEAYVPRYSRRLTKDLKNELNELISYYSPIVEELTNQLEKVEGFKSRSGFSFDSFRWYLDKGFDHVSVVYSFSHSSDKEMIMHIAERVLANNSDIEIESCKEVFSPNYFKPRLIGDWSINLSIKLSLNVKAKDESKELNEGTLTEVLHMSRNELMDTIDTLYHYLGDKIEHILSKHNASTDDSGEEGYFQTMSDDDMRNAFYEIKRFVIDRYSKYNYEECPTAVIELLELETVNESKELNESLSEKQIAEILNDAKHNSDDSQSEYYWIGYSAAAFLVKESDLFLLLPDHISEEDLEYKDMIRGYKDNNGMTIFNESKELNEALEDYKLTYYLSTATAERRPETIEDVENDWREETFAADSDYDALLYALELIDDGYDDTDFSTAEEIVQYFEEKDLGDGSAFVVKLEGPNGIIYDMGQTKEDFIEQVKENDEMLTYYRDVLGIDESLNEGNSVSGKIPPALDSFLQDIAQMYETIDYGDIMDHDYTEDDIRKLNNLRRRFITWAQYDEDDEEVKAKFNEIANKVAEILKRADEGMNEGRNNPYFTPYGYRDAAKILNRAAPEYYWHLKEIEMDRGDGIKLANYALKKGLPVMLDKNSDPDYPEFYLKDGSSEYHWGDYFYTYGFTNPDATDLIPYGGNLDVLNTEKDDSKMNEASSDRYLIDLEKAKNLTENDMIGKSGIWFYSKPSDDGWVEKYYLSHRKAGSRWSKYVSTKVTNDSWVIKIANEAGGMPFDSFDEAKAWLVDALESHLNESSKMNESLNESINDDTIELMRRAIDTVYSQVDDNEAIEEILRTYNANEDDSDRELGYFKGMSDEDIEGAYFEVKDYVIDKYTKRDLPQDIRKAFSFDYIEDELNESKELNESTNQYILFGFNHFSPDDLWEIKDSKENLEALISTYSGEGPLEYNEMIEDKGNLLFVEHNDEFISVQDTGYKTIEDFKKALYNTLDPMIQKDLEAGYEEGEYEFDMAPYYLFIDELTTTQAAVDYAMKLIEDSYVDGDSNSEYRFVDPKTITDNADVAREGLGDVEDQAWDDSWEEDIEDIEESLSNSREVRIAETLYKGNSILEDYDDFDDDFDDEYDDEGDEVIEYNYEVAIVDHDDKDYEWTIETLDTFDVGEYDNAIVSAKSHRTNPEYAEYDIVVLECADDDSDYDSPACGKEVYRLSAINEAKEPSNSVKLKGTFPELGSLTHEEQKQFNKWKKRKTKKEKDAPLNTKDNTYKIDNQNLEEDYEDGHQISIFDNIPEDEILQKHSTKNSTGKLLWDKICENVKKDIERQIRKSSTSEELDKCLDEVERTRKQDMLSDDVLDALESKIKAKQKKLQNIL